MAYDRDSFLAGLAVGRTLWRPHRDHGEAVPPWSILDVYYSPYSWVRGRSGDPVSDKETRKITSIINNDTGLPGQLEDVFFVQTTEYEGSFAGNNTIIMCCTYPATVEYEQAYRSYRWTGTMTIDDRTLGGYTSDKLYFLVSTGDLSYLPDTTYYWWDYAVPILCG